jgi:hypothetical protein
LLNGEYGYENDLRPRSLAGIDDRIGCFFPRHSGSHQAMPDRHRGLGRFNRSANGRQASGLGANEIVVINEPTAPTASTAAEAIYLKEKTHGYQGPHTLE